MRNRSGGSILNITIDIGWGVNVNVDTAPNFAMQVGTWPELSKINCYQVCFSRGPKAFHPTPVAIVGASLV
jgi:hypothetical protein